MPSPARLILVALVAALVPASAAAAAPRLDPRGLAVSGEAIVRFEPGTDPGERAAARDAAGVELERTLQLPRAQVVSFDGPVRAALTRLERRGDVAYAQPNYRYEALAPPPNDTFFGSLWGLGANPGVGALAAWDRTRGAGQVIAIVDSGIDLTHPDLADRLVPGFDFVDGDANPDDYQFHGTHVAGTAAATAGNGIGVAGVAPEASLMAVRVLDGNGGGTSSGVGSGIVYAAQQGADVINLSLGGPGGGDQFLSDALAVARNFDAVVVAAAGNEGNNNDAQPHTPCALPGEHLICVAALTSGGTLPGFSNFGATTVDLAAPGADILSAKTDWGAPLLVEGFEDDLAGWNLFSDGPAVDWGISGQSSAGAKSASDSPVGDYASNAYSEIHLAANLNLAGQRGCRMHFDLRYDVQLPGPSGLTDAFAAGAFAVGVPDLADGQLYVGSSGGVFEAAEASISGLDGRTDARPFFGLDSDASVVRDGVYLDDLRVLCRDGTYVDGVTDTAHYAEPDAGSYVRFSGTSMAAPHVSGIAALVRAADPGASAADVVRAIRDSATKRPALAGRVASGGSANAPAAIDAALAAPNQPPGGGGPVTASPAPAQPGPASAVPRRVLDLRGAPSSIRLKRSGRFAYTFRAAPGLRGEVVMRTGSQIRLAGGKRGRLTVAATRFRSPASGRVTLKLRLARGKLTVLRINRRLRLRVQVSVADSQGRVTRAARNLTLLPPR
jgi:thermitase